MNAHQFLARLQQGYDFNTTHRIFSQSGFSSCWKQWLTLELASVLASDSNIEQLETDVFYPAPNERQQALEQAQEKSQTKTQKKPQISDKKSPEANEKNNEKAIDKTFVETGFLRVQNGGDVSVTTRKTSASRCDFAFKQKEQSYFFELRCSHTDTYTKQKDLNKCLADIERINALKAANPELEIACLFAIYGVLTPQDTKALSLLDNNQFCSYALDPNLTGSSSISRLAHVKHSGKPRLILGMYSA
ncbi:hypothetical protein C2869_14165 [Saccharobesus litoralis]|uniref:Uncharacterized protein n=1 Tax=Saccharobesus litoralis TaxID=2172099 RepID=A0A2S0VTH4_9ALTE|nr:hypothetical protein [Saccharobesus litoralis]AWB67514.1 hypothetical protein C2869_14165 [Saccharobesus litoralis]